jgi:hypothetical protein
MIINNIIEICKEIILHWIIFVPGIVLLIIIIIGTSLLNIFLWIPLLVYYIWISTELPSTKGIDVWKDIYDTYLTDFTLKSDVYKKIFSVDFEDVELLHTSSDDKARLYLWHPHGIQVISLLVHRFWVSSPLYPILSKCKIASHSLIFKIPILRELALLLGFIPATKAHINHYLKSGSSVCLVPGGVKEMSYCVGEKDEVSKNKLYIGARKGFIKFGEKYELVPIYVHGEQQFMTIPSKNTTIELLNKILTAMSGYSVDMNLFLLFSPSIILEWLKVQIGLSSKMTKAYVGKPIKTTDINKYIINLQRLYKISLPADSNSQSELEIM